MMSRLESRRHDGSPHHPPSQPELLSQDQRLDSSRASSQSGRVGSSTLLPASATKTSTPEQRAAGPTPSPERRLRPRARALRGSALDPPREAAPGAKVVARGRPAAVGCGGSGTCRAGDGDTDTDGEVAWLAWVAPAEGDEARARSSMSGNGLLGLLQ